MGMRIKSRANFHFRTLLNKMARNSRNDNEYLEDSVNESEHEEEQASDLENFEEEWSEGEALDTVTVVNTKESCALPGKVGPKKAKKKGKAGRKAQWSDSCTDDLIDIICSNDVFQKKLIFTNVKTARNGIYYSKIMTELKQRCERRQELFPFDIRQIREKFKRCVSECKKASLVMKTASGIKRFQEEKGHSKRFNCLLPLVQSRASCQPDQAIDPSSNLKRKICQNEENSPSTSNGSFSADDEVGDIETTGESSKSAKELFVPHKGGKRNKKAIDETICQVLEKISSKLEEDPTNKLLKYFEKENENARQHEMRMFSLMYGNGRPSGMDNFQQQQTGFNGQMQFHGREFNCNPVNIQQGTQFHGFSNMLNEVDENVNCYQEL